MLCYVYPISCRQDIEVSSEGPHPYGYSLWKNAKTRTENRSCGKWTGSLPWHYYQTLPPQALCHYPSARQIPFLLYCLMSSKKYCCQIAVLMTVRHSFQTIYPWTRWIVCYPTLQTVLTFSFQAFRSLTISLAISIPMNLWQNYTFFLWKKGSVDILRGWLSTMTT